MPGYTPNNLWFLYFRKMSWDAYFKMVSSKATALWKKKGKTKLTWTDLDMDAFPEGIFDPQYRASQITPLGGLQYWNIWH